MKVFLLTLVLAIAALGEAWAQGTPCGRHPSDPNAVLVGSYTVTVNLSSAQVGARKAGGSKKSTASSTESLVCVWRTSGGKIDYVIDPASIRFSNDCESMDSISTTALLDLLAQAAVAKGIQLGFTSCTSNCDGIGDARVYSVSCVIRTGSGESTRFSACDVTTYCARDYSICCPYGPTAPYIQQLPAPFTACGGAAEGCESTCP